MECSSLLEYVAATYEEEAEVSLVGSVEGEREGEGGRLAGMSSLAEVGIGEGVLSPTIVTICSAFRFKKYGHELGKAGSGELTVVGVSEGDGSGDGCWAVGEGGKEGQSLTK